MVGTLFLEWLEISDMPSLILTLVSHVLYRINGRNCYGEISISRSLDECSDPYEKEADHL